MLNKYQIDYLFTYCSENGVKYYDVQTELVDHLANAIESEQKENPSLNFDAALKKVRLSFGYNGFNQMAIKKQNEAKRNSRFLLWKSFKNQFQWPKIILGVLLFLSFYSIAELTSITTNKIDKIFFKSIPLFISFFILFQVFKLYWIEKKSKKKFTMIQETNFATTYLGTINLLSLFTPIFNWLQNGDKLILMSLSIFFALYSVLGIAIIATLKQIEKKVSSEYLSILVVAK